MFDITKPTKVSCKQVLNGLNAISIAAQSIYGTDRKILCQSSSGEIVCSSHMKEVIVNGSFRDAEAELVRKLLVTINLPEDGVKTSLLLAEEMLAIAHEQEFDMNAFLDDVKLLTDKAIDEYVIIEATTSSLPGSGLFLMNVIHPIYRTISQNGFGKTGKAQMMLSAFHSPIKALARNSGKDPIELFHCVKQAAPTQFYSLHHFGMERSIPKTDDRDLWRYGIELDSGKIVNVFEKGITIPTTTAILIMQLTADICKTMCLIQSII